MSGPIRLREKPHTDHVNREAFDLPEGSDLVDFMALAERHLEQHGDEADRAAIPGYCCPRCEAEAHE